MDEFEIAEGPDLASFLQDTPKPAPKPRREPYEAVPHWVMQAIHDTGGQRSASFWALAIYTAARKESLRPYSKHRKGDRWVEITRAMLPKGAKLIGKTKVAALRLLEAAGVFEVKTFPRSSPWVRLRSRAKSEAVPDSSGTAT